MVGVPGKSKGCHTCRRRKVKCDEGRPYCERCYNSGRECQGYQKRAVFLNRAQTGLLKRGPLEEAILHTQSSPILLSQCQNTPSQQMDLTPTCKRKIEEWFLERFLASDYSSQKPTPGYYVFDIMCEISRDTLLESAIQALCLTRVGRMTNDDRLLQQGFESYTSAVRKLHVAMSQASTRVQDSTLAAAKIMNLYEFYEPSYPRGMAVYNHIIGVEMLACLRESNGAVRPEFMRALLRSTRYNSMIACIKGFSLNSPFACSKLEDADGDGIENFEHTLMDIGFVIATVVRDYEYLRIQLLGNESSVGIERLTTRCYEVYDYLQIWYAKFAKRDSSSLYWNSIEEENILRNKISPLCFSHISIAHILIDYWALSIIIGRVSEQLSLFIKAKSLSTFITDQEALELFHEAAGKNHSDKQIEFALKILASVDFCDRQETGLAGKDHLFGLGIALRLFRMLPGVGAKILEQNTIKILHRIADGGLQFARCLVQQAQTEIREHLHTTEEFHTLAEMRWGSGYQQQRP